MIGHTHSRPRARGRVRACLAALALSMGLLAPIVAVAQTLVPTIVGGSDNGTTRRTLLTDSSGRLQVIGSASGGSVFGPDAVNTVPTAAPLSTACFGSSTGPTVVTTGRIQYVWCDTSGRLNVNVATALPTGANVIGAVTQSGTWNVGTVTAVTAITNALPVGANTIGNVNAIQSGTWTVQPGNTANTTAWLMTGNVTAADNAALTATLRTYDQLGLYDGTTTDFARSIEGASAGTGVGVTAVAVAPNSSANAAITSVQCSAVCSGLVIKASAGNLYHISATSGATAGYLLVTNTTTVPADGAVTPAICRVLPANSSIEVDHSTAPDRFATGVSAAFSTTGCFTKTASATAQIEGSAF